MVSTIASQTAKHIFRLHFNPQKNPPFLSVRLNLERRPAVHPPPFHLACCHPHTSSANLRISHRAEALIRADLQQLSRRTACHLARGRFSSVNVCGYRTVSLNQPIPELTWLKQAQDETSELIPSPCCFSNNHTVLSRLISEIWEHDQTNSLSNWEGAHLKLRALSAETHSEAADSAHNSTGSSPRAVTTFTLSYDASLL